MDRLCVAAVMEEERDRSQTKLVLCGSIIAQMSGLLVGECKWTHGKMPLSVLEDLRVHKLPALARAKGIKASSRQPRVLLFARSGFDRGLHEAAGEDGSIELIDAAGLVDGIVSAQGPLPLGGRASRQAAL